MIDTIASYEFRTPRGNTATFELRMEPETTDWNTVNSIMGDANNEDEYGIASRYLTGWAIDVGSHVGGMAIALAIDNPDLRVIAIEPVPSNVEQLKRNVLLNGLSERVFVIDGAAGIDGECQIAWNWTGEGSGREEPAKSSLTGHRYIGGSSLALANPGVPHDEVTVQSWSLEGLMTYYAIRDIAFLKIDCEGCEAQFLDSPAVKNVAIIAGEWHPPYIAGQPHMRRLLEATHDLTWLPAPVRDEHGDIDIKVREQILRDGPCGFLAIRR